MKKLKSLAEGSTPIVGLALMVNLGTYEFNIIGFVSISNSKFSKNNKYQNRPCDGE